MAAAISQKVINANTMLVVRKVSGGIWLVAYFITVQLTPQMTVIINKI